MAIMRFVVLLLLLSVSEANTLNYTVLTANTTSAPIEISLNNTWTYFTFNTTSGKAYTITTTGPFGSLLHTYVNRNSKPDDKNAFEFENDRGGKVRVNPCIGDLGVLYIGVTFWWSGCRDGDDDNRNGLCNAANVTVTVSETYASAPTDLQLGTPTQLEALSGTNYVHVTLPSDFNASTHLLNVSMPQSDPNFYLSWEMRFLENATCPTEATTSGASVANNAKNHYISLLSAGVTSLTIGFSLWLDQTETVTVSLDPYACDSTCIWCETQGECPAGVCTWSVWSTKPCRPSECDAEHCGLCTELACSYYSECAWTGSTCAARAAPSPSPSPSLSASASSSPSTSPSMSTGPGTGSPSPSPSPGKGGPEPSPNTLNSGASAFALKYTFFFALAVSLSTILVLAWRNG